MTYAYYRLWAGVLLKDADVDNDFIKRVLNTLEPIREMGTGGYHFSRIHMHGETVGIGVEIIDLDWTTVEEGPSEYREVDSWIGDPDSILSSVEKALRGYGVEARAKLYHHIDLGG
jgi:hypothetical protein